MRFWVGKSVDLGSSYVLAFGYDDKNLRVPVVYNLAKLKLKFNGLGMLL